MRHVGHCEGRIAQADDWNDAGDMAGNDAEAVLAAQGYGTTLWTPSEKSIATARITHYARWLADHGVITATNEDGTGGRGPGAGKPEEQYAALWQWSVERPGEFWDSVWRYFDVLGDRGDGAALASAVMPGAEWFPGVTLN
ncbi:MAG: acetyl-coenzyme A synthetase N-terminal domain-containing protein, partial [Gemmatimonadaceae bacterium]